MSAITCDDRTMQDMINMLSGNKFDVWMSERGNEDVVYMNTELEPDLFDAIEAEVSNSVGADEYGVRHIQLSTTAFEATKDGVTWTGKVLSLYRGGRQ